MIDPVQTPAASPDHRTRIARAIALATILIVPSLYSFHFMSFMDAKLIGLGLGLLVLSVVIPARQLSELKGGGRFVPLAILIAWGAGVSIMRQTDTFTGTQSGANAAYALILASSLFILAAIPCGQSSKIPLVVALSAIPVAALALLQRMGLLSAMFPVFPDYDQSMYSVFGNQNLLGGYVAIAFSTLISLWLRGEIRAPLIFASSSVLFPALVLSGSRSAWLAAFVGLSFGLIQGRQRLRSIAIVVLGAAIAGSGIAFLAPSATFDRIAMSFGSSDVGYRIRLWIWDTALHLIRQHPLMGVGNGEFAFYSPRAAGEVLQIRGPGYHMFNHIHTFHAHSDLLEIAADTGIVGVTLLTAFILMIPRRRSAAWSGLAAAFIFSLVNTTLHSPAHMLAVLLLAGSLSTSSAVQGKPADVFSIFAIRFIAMAAAAVFVLAALLRVVIPSALHAHAQQIYENDPEHSDDAYARALGLFSNPIAYEDFATILANKGREGDAERQAYLATLGLDTGSIHYLRGYLAERRKSPRDALFFYRECLLRWPDHAPAYAGLLRNSAAGERDAILAEAKRWLSPEDYAVLRATPSEAPQRTPLRP